MAKKFILCIIIISLIFNSGWLTAIGKEVDIKPSKDTYVHSGFGDTNYGSSSELFAWIESGGFTMYPLFGFSLAKIPARSRISRATLNVYGSANVTPQNVTANQVTSNWEEDQVTYNNFSNAYSQTSLSTSQVGTPAAYSSWDVTGLVKQWYSKQTNNYGLTLIDITDDPNWITFHVGNLEKYPYLRIFYFADFVRTLIRVFAKHLIVFGQILNIQGSLKDANGVSIENKIIYFLMQVAASRPGSNSKTGAKSKWKRIGKAKTNKKGRFSFKYKPSKTAIYKVYFPGDKKYKKTYSKAFKVKVEKK